MSNPLITVNRVFDALTSPRVANRRPFEDVPSIWKAALTGSQFDVVDEVLVRLMTMSNIPRSVVVAVAHEAAPFGHYLKFWKRYEMHVNATDSAPYNEANQLSDHLVKGQATDLTVEAVYPGTRYDITGFYTGGNDAAQSPDGFSSRFSRLSLIFQNGAPSEAGMNGVTIESLLAVCKHRLEGFQASPFACQENQAALDNITDALTALKSRSARRMNQGVEGTLTPEPGKPKVTYVAR